MKREGNEQMEEREMEKGDFHPEKKVKSSKVVPYGVVD